MATPVSATPVSAASVTSGSIDVNALVKQLMTVEQIPINKLATQTASYQAKLTAIGTIQGAMYSFQSSVATLSNASTFQGVSATASDTTTLSASALTSAVSGSYSIGISSLAQAQTLVATGQTGISNAIGGGTTTTLSFDAGTIAGTLTGGSYAPGATFASNGSGIKTVTINSTNNSLQGIRDAINAANVGVTASIINDGSATPYRLVMTSNNSGVTNSMKISATGDATVSSLLANDPTGVQNMTETVSATNAIMTVNGIAISKPSNSVSDVIPGVTLNLSTVTTTPTTLTVAKDTASVVTSVNDFVKSFNSLNKTLSDLSAYDPTTKKSAILQGDAMVRNLQSQLRGILNVPGAGALTNMAQIGVTFQRDGSLAVDSAKLNKAMASNFNDIAGLFAATGQASDSLVTYNSATKDTKPGSYPLTVTHLATQGNETGTAAPSTLVIAAGVNDTLNMNINGISTTITLTPQTYTSAQALATDLQSKINGVTALSSAGISVSAALNAGKISLTSNSYGHLSSVVASSGNGVANIFGTALSTTGTDVTGTLNGVAATGVGQTLTGNGNALGLSLLINGGALGARGTVSYTQGYAYQLNNFSTQVLSSTGSITSSTTDVNTSITDLANRTAVLQQRLIGTEFRYRAQFTALDQLLTNMSTTSSFLSQQLSQMA